MGRARAVAAKCWIQGCWVGHRHRYHGILLNHRRGRVQEWFACRGQSKGVPSGFSRANRRKQACLTDLRRSRALDLLGILERSPMFFRVLTATWGNVGCRRIFSDLLSRPQGLRSLSVASLESKVAGGDAMEEAGTAAPASAPVKIGDLGPRSRNVNVLFKVVKAGDVREVLGLQIRHV
jgi:hypothetical protein